MRMSRLLAVIVVLAFTSVCNSPEATDPVDLMDAAYVVFAPVDEQEVPTRIQLDGDTRRALAASLPAEFRYRIQVPERALLTFTVAIITAPDGPPTEASNRLARHPRPATTPPAATTAA